MKELTWRKICCPVDFSETSRAALDVAVDLCRRFGAALTLLHVRDVGAADGEAAAWERDVRAAGVPLETAEEAGDPKTVIADYANRNGFDAVVMGTHGRTGRTHSMVGSVAESTVRQAHCPVMVVHAEWAAAGAR
jgi:universal stress protein A